MSWTAQKNFVIFVILVFGLQVSQSWEASEWGGKYSQETICGLTGTTVIFNCSFWYPQTHDGHIITVEKTLWFTKSYNDRPEDLTMDPQYTDRLDLNCQGSSCTLSIRELRKSDEGKYKFKFITNAPKGEHTVVSGVTLNVTDLSIAPFESWLLRTVTCESECDSPVDSPSYIWYENGKKKQDWNYVMMPASYDVSYSCALRGHEQHLSPPVCLRNSCDKVLYEYKSICALKGSDVDITCTYSHHKTVQEKSWFCPDNGNTWNVLPVLRAWQLDHRYSTFDMYGKRSWLRIKNVTESDSADYRFKFSEWGSDLPGTTLTVTAARVQVIKAEKNDSYTVALLSCHLSCSPGARLSWCWMRNRGQNVDCSYKRTKEQIITLRPGEHITCAVEGYPLSVSLPLYALKAPRVFLSHKSEIVEGDLLTLTCIADTPTSSRHRWYKKCRTSDCEVMGYGEKLVFIAIMSSDSAEYFCAVENDLGVKMSQPVVIDVKYAPRFSNLLVRPSNVAEEGQPVNLTCSSDANPAASYTWYKDQTMLQDSERNYYVFNSISAEDAGSYKCMAENEYGLALSSLVVVDIQYVPRLPSISARPCTNVSIGSSVRLTCTSDANPAASYFWYKDHEESPRFTGAMFNIINFQQDNEGEYHCVARNSQGSRNATVLLRAEKFRSRSQGALTAVAVRYATAGILLILLLVTVLLFWKKTTSKGRMHSKFQPNTNEDSSRDQLKEGVAFSEHSPIYSNVTNDKTDQDEDEYDSVVDTVI
ncbi:carcinoembryonic antigen-related cell adhesion molecule 5-like [Corythoichthys intestinalis]|uniref:carcinoembryonic antigen-related cell adhesion molecule 5-like n=1 Tax=Corythoichthys intestinalis TaxID=161448 RepID=UPI0025A66C27|nr:carcinoembryonic antigen-related cell adhesion molecule 5-like [Corythoichthys intestinalis]